MVVIQASRQAVWKIGQTRVWITGACYYSGCYLISPSLSFFFICIMGSIIGPALWGCCEEKLTNTHKNFAVCIQKPLWLLALVIIIWKWGNWGTLSQIRLGRECFTDLEPRSLEFRLIRPSSSPAHHTRLPGAPLLFTRHCETCHHGEGVWLVFMAWGGLE